MLSQTRNTGPVMTSRRQTNCCAAVDVGEPESKHGEMKIAGVSCKDISQPAFLEVVEPGVTTRARLMDGQTGGRRRS